MREFKDAITGKDKDAADEAAPKPPELTAAAVEPAQPQAAEKPTTVDQG
jgi:hypothetical protein